jgi:putative aldouronate transport system substrate-binding protein
VTLATGVGAGFAAIGTSTTHAAPQTPASVSLTYIYAGSSDQKALPDVETALSKMLMERVSATVKLVTFDWGTFDQKISLANAAGEKHDLYYTAPWINNYYTNIRQEYLLKLEKLLPDLAPKLWASMTPETWDAARVGGSIYAAINQQIFVKPFGPYIRTDVAGASGVEDAFRAMKSYDEIGPIMAQVKKYIDGQKGTLQFVTAAPNININEIYGYDVVDSGLVVKSTDASAKVGLYSETAEYAGAAASIRSWNNMGYTPSEPKTASEQQEAWKAGQSAMLMASVVKPGGDAEIRARWGHDVISVAIAEPLLTTGGSTATMTGVNSLSPNPEAAVKFIELLNSDVVFYNTLCKGIEGVHWEWDDKESLLIRPANGKASYADTGYNPNTDWQFGNVFNSYYTSKSQIGAWPATAELNRNARPSPLLGFTFDPKSVDTERAACAAVAKEFGEPLGFGVVDPNAQIPALNKALKEAGIDKIRAEMQRQIDAWLAAKKR